MLEKKHPYSIVQINPNTAKALDINDGDWVWIETSRGRARQKAKLFEGIKENTVHAEHGWWLLELPGEEPWLHGVWEVNINMALSDDPEQCNPELGSWPFS
ncbi:MAG: molybdopterin dinucleotide binding domain-containing protein [Bacillota bacterium]